VPRAKRKTLVDDDGCDVGIEHRRAERVFQASDDHRLIDERVERTPQPAPFGGKVLPAGGGQAGDDQGLEIGPARLAAAERGRQQIRRAALAVVVQIPVARMLAERAGHQRLRDPGRQRQTGRRIAGSCALLQRRHQLQAGIAMELLGHRQIVQQGLVSGAVACARRPCPGRVDQVTPVVGAGARPRQELIDAMRCGLCVLGHVFSPASFEGVWSTMVPSRRRPLIQVNGSWPC
jgi:hypothetical protein